PPTAHTQGTSPTLLAPMPDAHVWDISNFSLVDGHLVLVGTSQEASGRGRNQAESSEGTNLHPTGTHWDPAVDEKGTEGTMRGTESETSSPSQFSNVKGLLWKRLRERRGRSAPRAVPPAVPVPNGDRVPSCSGSHESLVPVPRVTQLDLSGHSLIVRPVHGSIVGEKFCFQIITGEGSSTFGCSSLAEREQWIENLRRSAQPNKDNRERLELALTLCIYEGRELPPRRRLRCQLHLDGLLFARTTAKVPGPDGDLFWGELFQLPSLPPCQTLTLSQPLERWSPLSGGAAGSQRAPALRLRGRYREVKVLPIVCYKELAEFITFHYRELCARLEPAIAARHKEELASALVRVLQSTGKAK
ncbi:DAB2P protein, partial [Semnornis frantzii]|nr:DAB2P protein [Semnornis frantzii]